VADITQMVGGWQRLRQLASAPQYIIPGHDPLVMRSYPEAEPALRGIAVRLDVEPLELA
jgi:glyoxylase-like metal-dependent hydrolase (beta-lactamase superfamily II)